MKVLSLKKYLHCLMIYILLKYTIRIYKLYTKNVLLNFSITKLIKLASRSLRLSEQTISTGTILPAKSDSDAMFCLQSYQGLRIDRSLVY